MKEVGRHIKVLMKSHRMDQRDLALQSGMSFQNVSAVLAGRRALTPAQSVRFDDIFGLEPGFFFRMQASELLKKCREGPMPSALKLDVLFRVKENGGLWSYDGVPSSFSDDDIIEEGLRHLDLDDMKILFRLWSPSHIRRVWKERLVPEGNRSNILNTLLGMFCFGMDYIQVNRYLLRHGNS